MQVPSRREEEAERCSPAPEAPSVPNLSAGPRAPELPVFRRPKRLERGLSSGVWGNRKVSVVEKGSLFPYISNATPRRTEKKLQLPSAPGGGATRKGSQLYWRILGTVVFTLPAQTRGLQDSGEPSHSLQGTQTHLRTLRAGGRGGGNSIEGSGFCSGWLYWVRKQDPSEEHARCL